MLAFFKLGSIRWKIEMTKKNLDLNNGDIYEKY